jgi:small subunit ribosomal protein S1
MSLGLKQLTEEPWAAVDKKFTVGQIVNGTVTRLANFGAFVELDKGVEGLVHVSDFSWTERVAQPSDKVNEGDTVKVKILNIDRHEQKIALGIKQVAGDPMETFLKAHPVGSIVTGPVSSLTDFGAFVTLAENLEGLVHASQISDQKDKKPDDLLKVGQQVTVKLVEVDRKERRLRLSIRQALADQERKDLEAYARKAGKETGTTVGERLDEKTREKLRKARKSAVESARGGGTDGDEKAE